MQQYRFRQLDVPSVEELVDSSDVFNELTLRVLPCAGEILPCTGESFFLPCTVEILPCTGESFFLPCACEIREFRLFPEMKFSPVQFTSAQLPSCRPLPEKWATVV